METKTLGEELLDLHEKNLVNCVTIRELLTAEFRPREQILSPWLPTQGLAMIYAERGTGKTFVSVGIACTVASGGRFWKWEAPRPRNVLFIDGELPGATIQERFARQIASSEREPEAEIKIITPDLQDNSMPNLFSSTGQEAIRPHLEGVELVIVDNISTLCWSGGENKAEDWYPIQEWALNLRRQGISVLFIHHAGRNGLSRGTSKREDVLDSMISLKRPGDYNPEQGARFIVNFEKARGVYGDHVKSFEAWLKGDSDLYEWEIKDAEASLVERVAALLNEGLLQNDIVDVLKISKGYVSRLKKKAYTQGLLRDER